ncbi:hypothetical protein NLJ89_g3145 [Agrocybe chaxingu]|uniref:Uncharacterized protein n=1 Tax=Agrocybe chaxingu TaxID=84603 RepID=A0A9W8K597_9AGAR|nr:hypothetical protein NLJ89_g3145 [Agrocybe chaxingu]
MRFNVILSVTFLASFAAGLVIPSNEVESRGLEIRDGLIDDPVDSIVFKRDPKRTKAQKARTAAARTERIKKKGEKKASFQAAAKAHKKTTNLPARTSTFHVPAGGGKPAHTYTGKDVRKAVFDSHREAQRIKTLSKTQAKKSPLKSFSNHPHESPKPGGGAKPLPHMTVDKTKKHTQPGREFPLPNHHNPSTPSPARVITQKTKGGHYTFKGVISHDQSRTDKTKGAGYNDHFQVKERKRKGK